VVFPFSETLQNAFNQMSSVRHIGFRSGKGRCFTFLKTQDPEEIDSVRAVIDKIGKYVAVRDCLALSFALDYDREGGDRPIGHDRV